MATPVPKKVAERAADEALKLLDEVPAPDGDGEELAATKHQDPRRTWAARAVGGRAFSAAWQRCTWMTNLIADTGFWGAAQNPIDRYRSPDRVSAGQGFDSVGTAGFEPTTP
ncbi:MAG TPA: hypothetical protein VFM55_26825 [Micromonosporaceae bacterium]|nr:hypothetical protein [Micromonosporaceae bacterium]